MVPENNDCIITHLKSSRHAAGASVFPDLLYFTMLRAHPAASLLSAPDANLFPSSQFPVPAFSRSIDALFPMPEDSDVQNGITVLPVKSFFVTNWLTGHAALPHQIG